MQMHLKRDLACLSLLLLVGTCSATAQSSSVTSAVDGSVPTSANSAASGQAPDSGVSGMPAGSGGMGAGYGLFGAGGKAFNTPIQTPIEKTANGLIDRSAGSPSSSLSASISSRAALQAGATMEPAALPAPSSPASLPQTSGGGGGEYTDSFPDSAEGRAVLSPPTGSNAAVFGFSTSLEPGFADLNQRQFLDPELHVHMKASLKKQNQDLFQKLESRRKSKSAPKGNLFGRQKKSPFAKQSPFQQQQQELKRDSTLDTSNF